MNKSDKVGYYGNGISGNVPSDYDFFYSQNKNNGNPFQPSFNGNNQAPLGVNGVTPVDLFNFMDNNFRGPKPNDTQLFDYPQRPGVNGPRNTMEQKANQFINQRSMTTPQSPMVPMAPINRNPPGLMVGTVYAKPVKNRVNINNNWGYRVGSAPQQENQQTNQTK